MTTIIADAKRKVIVSDSRITTQSGLTQYAAEKVYRVGKSIYGEAGDNENGLKFRRWVLDGQPKKGRPAFGNTTDDEFCVLEIDREGMWMWDQTMVRQKLLEDVFAVGSGAKIALYAIKVLGKSAEEAIEEAAKIDMHTAPPVQCLSLKDKD